MLQTVHFTVACAPYVNHRGYRIDRMQFVVYPAVGLEFAEGKPVRCNRLLNNCGNYHPIGEFPTACDAYLAARAHALPETREQTIERERKEHEAFMELAGIYRESFLYGGGTFSKGHGYWIQGRTNDGLLTGNKHFWWYEDAVYEFGITKRPTKVYEFSLIALHNAMCRLKTILQERWDSGDYRISPVLCTVDDGALAETSFFTTHEDVVDLCRQVGPGIRWHFRTPFAPIEGVDADQYYANLRAAREPVAA